MRHGAEALLRQADDLLYRAKAAGRDRAYVAAAGERTESTQSGERTKHGGCGVA